MLTTNLAGVRLASPLVLASGVLGLTASGMRRVIEFGAGAVTTKSTGLEPRTGHKAPSILPWEHGMLNAVGLSNPGADWMASEIRQFKETGKGRVIASVFGRTPAEFAEVADKLLDSKPDMFEANVSCPNVRSEFGEPFGANIETTVEITRLLKKVAVGIPVSIKLTVNCPSIARMALAVEEAGADAVTAINTVGPGMLIDLNTRRPILSNKTGGVSGPAMFPIALRAVYQIRAVSKIPILATGGVRTAEDALQLFMAGATAIGIGTAVHTDGIEVFDQVNPPSPHPKSHHPDRPTEFRHGADTAVKKAGAGLLDHRHGCEM